MLYWYDIVSCPSVCQMWAYCWLNWLAGVQPKDYFYYRVGGEWDLVSIAMLAYRSARGWSSLKINKPLMWNMVAIHNRHRIACSASGSITCLSVTGRPLALRNMIIIFKQPDYISPLDYYTLGCKGSVKNSNSLLKRKWWSSSLMNDEPLTMWIYAGIQWTEKRWQKHPITMCVTTSLHGNIYGKWPYSSTMLRKKAFWLLDIKGPLKTTLNLPKGCAVLIMWAWTVNGWNCGLCSAHVLQALVNCIMSSIEYGNSGFHKVEHTGEPCMGDIENYGVC